MVFSFSFLFGLFLETLVLSSLPFITETNRKSAKFGFQDSMIV